MIPPSRKEQGSVPSSSSAACAVASARVSLSESETEDEVLSTIADSFVVPQWDDNARVTELANTRTARTRAGVPIHDTYVGGCGCQPETNCHCDQLARRGGS